jgi:valyl-tRNA synthetase
MSELPKTFDPAAIEARWYPYWEEEGLFRPERPDAEPWTIVNPPPNVTGALHIGHALDNTLQDILTRHARLQGKDALWVVGMDHAGIATQMVVERNLEKEGVRRADLGRDEFVRRVWAWKEESGGEITGQLRRLGCSMDWANERFTMDEGFSRAVLKVFVQLYREGLLYRDKRLVNWDPEVRNRHLRSRSRDEGGPGQVLAPRNIRWRTQRLHPGRTTTARDDARRHGGRGASGRRSLPRVGGQEDQAPATGRLIPIITDEHADPELGSGAVKITPGHDFNDFEVGRRAGIKAADMLNMLDAGAGSRRLRTGSFRRSWSASTASMLGHALSRGSTR